MAKKKLSARVRAWMIEYAYLVTLGAIAAIVASSALYAYGMRKENALQAAAQAPETKQEATRPPRPEPTPLPTIAPLAVRTEMLRTAGRTAWPTGGSIARGYDPQEAVYWEALACYKPHAGLDIAGEAGEEVCAIAEGVAAAIGRDELWGLSAEITLADGRSMVYRGLEAAFVHAGEKIACGQTLGVLMAKIPCEGETGAHVHVELMKDGKYQDPGALLPEKR